MPLGPRTAAVMMEIALVLAGILGGVAVLLIGHTLGLFPTDKAFSFVAGPLVTFCAVGIYGKLGAALDVGVEPAEPVERYPWPRKPFAWCLGAVVVGAVFAALGSFLLGILMKFIGVPVQEQGAVLEITAAARNGEGRIDLIMLIVSATVLAPIAEEWLFRGLLLRRLHAKAGMVAALLVSATAFSLNHLHPAGYVVYLWLGLVFAGTYVKTGRLWTAMAVHFVNNAFALTMLLLG